MPRVSGHNLGVTATKVSVSLKPSPQSCILNNWNWLMCSKSKEYMYNNVREKESR